MGLLRPSRRVTSQSGDEWEIYVSKTALPAWRGSDSDDMSIEGLPDIPIAIVAALWANVIVPLHASSCSCRSPPCAAVALARCASVTSFPHRQVLLWTTTDVHLARVVDEIAAGLARGTVARPEGAYYSGPEEP